MSNVLFLFENQNSFGLFDSFAKVLLTQSYTPCFLDMNALYDKKEDLANRNLVVQNGFTYVESASKVPDRNDPRVFENVKSIFDSVQPVLIVVPFEFNIFQFFIAHAKNMDIPTIHIQHALWNPGKFLPGYNTHPELHHNLKKSQSIFSRAERKLKIAFKHLLTSHKFSKEIQPAIFKYKMYRVDDLPFPVRSDYMSVPSDYYKDMVLNEVKYAKPQNIIVNGYMRDNLFQFNENDQLSDKFDMPSGRNVISYFYTPFYLYKKMYIEKYNSLQALIDFIRESTDVFKDQNPYFLILIHPTQVHEIDYTRQKLKEAGIFDFCIDTSKNNQGLIYKRSLIVGGAKTSALIEARALNPKVLRQDYVLEGNFTNSYEDLEGVTIVKKPEDLRKSIEALNSGMLNQECELVKSVFGTNVGQSSQRLFEILKERKIL